MKTFIFIVAFLVNFVHAVESTHAMEQSSPFNEPLAKFLVRAYSMPKWDRKWDEQEREIIKEKKIPELISFSKLVVEDKLQNDSKKINVAFNLSNYTRLIDSARFLVSKKIGENLPEDTPLYKHIGALSAYLVSIGEVDIKKADSICDALLVDIGNKKILDQAKDKHEERIQSFISEKLKIDIQEIQENDKKGANAGFIATAFNGDRYFVKTFSVDQDLDKIDCREIFAYKVLEHLGFGPETHCLIQRFSSSQGSRARGAYIMTKDVAINHDPENIMSKQFFRDGDNEHKEYYADAIKDEIFQIELFAIASLNKILRLRDTFGANERNYGIIRTEMRDKKVKYEPVLIDHLPCTTNEIMKEEYSPGSFLRTRLRETPSDSNLASLIVDMENFSSKGMNLVKEVKRMVMEGKKQKSFEDAIDKSSKYIVDLIEYDGNSFKDVKGEHGHISAEDMIKDHVKVVYQNYHTFLESYA